MTASTPPSPEATRGGLFGWMQRKPKAAFFSTLAVSLLLGLVIGVAAGSQQAEVDRQTERAEAAEAELTSVRSDLDDVEEERDDAEAQVASLQDRVERLTSKGQVPDFTGQDIDDARDEDAVSDYDWNIKAVQQITSEASPGTVLSQTPKEGTVLKAGRSVTLTVAKKPPPKPPEWVTIKTLSGAGSTKTDEFTVPSGYKARLAYSMPSDGNNAIILYQAPDEYIDLLLNEIGPQSGSTRLYRPGRFYLDVTGSYTINVQVFKRPE